MIITHNPATKQLHENWKQRINFEFSNTDFSTSSDYLCLINYLDKTPQKFYSKEAFVKYHLTLEQIKEQDPNLLSVIIKDSESLLSISNKVLNEVNVKPIHDILLPKEHNEIINFIDKEIHYNLLKIYETPFFHFSYILSKYYWIKSNKRTDGLDLYNSVEQLKKIGFEFINKIYLHDVRNGIAHGKIIFSDLDITYIDKKGKKASIPTRTIIETFDETLNIVNGFCLAFKIFCLTNFEYFNNYNISIPQSILLEELQAKVNGPAWMITNCLESVALQDKKQLMIYVKNNNWDFRKVYWYCFVTAYWADMLAKNYDRIFFSLYSKHSKISPNGWAAFDGKKFKELREQYETKIEAYNGVLEGDLLFFIPKIKFPRLIYKIGTFLSIIRTSFPLVWRNIIDTNFPKPFFIRETQIYSKGNFTVIADPSVIIRPNFQNDIVSLIRTNKKRIVRLAIKYSRYHCSLFLLARYLPVKYIRVFIYDSDKRVRNLRHSGLVPELVASIEINTTKRIKTIDILGGIPEQNGKYRIVWNKNWRGISKYYDNF